MGMGRVDEKLDGWMDDGEIPSSGAGGVEEDGYIGSFSLSFFFLFFCPPPPRNKGIVTRVLFDFS